MNQIEFGRGMRGQSMKRLLEAYRQLYGPGNEIGVTMPGEALAQLSCRCLDIRQNCSIKSLRRSKEYLWDTIAIYSNIYARTVLIGNCCGLRDWRRNWRKGVLSTTIEARRSRSVRGLRAAKQIPTVFFQNESQLTAGSRG